MKTIKGSFVALVTPFQSNGDIDFKALRRLIAFQVSGGTSAILVNGTTAESPCISLEEFDTLTKFVVEEVAGRIPVFAGTGSNNTEQAIIKSQIAEYNGVDGLLVVSPCYSKPTRRGMSTYFRAISDSTKLPIIMYNVPGRTGSNMELELVVELAREIENIVGIKEASGDMDRIMSLIHCCPQDFAIYSGDDSLALSTVLLGGAGCISVVANQIPKVFSQMIKSALEGEIEIARSLHYKYLDLMNLNFVESNPIPVKTALAKMGMIDLHFRSPMCEMEEENAELIYQELENLELISCEKPIELVLD